MTDTRPVLFARKPLVDPSTQLGATSGEVRSLVSEARRAGGFFASRRIQKQINGEVVHSVGEAIQAYFAAKREELSYRTQLALDVAMKQAVKDNLAATAVIEREIVRLTQEVIGELLNGKLAVSGQAERDVASRLRELEAAKARGDVTEAGYERQLRAIEGVAVEIGEKADALAARVIENLGQRLDAALRTYQGKPS